MDPICGNVLSELLEKDRVVHVALRMNVLR